MGLKQLRLEQIRFILTGIPVRCPTTQEQADLDQKIADTVELLSPLFGEKGLQLLIDASKGQARLILLSTVSPPVPFVRQWLLHPGSRSLPAFIGLCDEIIDVTRNYGCQVFDDLDDPEFS